MLGEMNLGSSLGMAAVERMELLVASSSQVVPPSRETSTRALSRINVLPLPFVTTTPFVLTSSDSKK